VLAEVDPEREDFITTSHDIREHTGKRAPLKDAERGGSGSVRPMGRARRL
jgi:hypothetical protein